MSRLLETIKIENRSIRNADFHNRRMNTSRKDLFGITSELDIRQLIKIPIEMGMGIFKCRILYDKMIREVQVLPYHTRTISSLKLVMDDDIDYRYKYADRSHLDKLLSKKGNCDDVLIVKNACISDTSAANILFQRHDGSWVTPDTPLLSGTMRQLLLEEGKISEQRIGEEDLSAFSNARLINCMMDMDTCPAIPIKNIFC